MKKVLLVAAALLSLSWGRSVMACGADADCRPGGVGTQVCVCPDTSGQAPDVSSGQACGNTEVIPGVLEIGGCANSAGANGCIEVAETVTLGGGSGSLPSTITDHAACDAAANAACLACGCGVCADSAEL